MLCSKTIAQLEAIYFSCRLWYIFVWESFLDFYGNHFYNFCICKSKVPLLQSSMGATICSANVEVLCHFLSMGESFHTEKLCQHLLHMSRSPWLSRLSFSQLLCMSTQK